MSATDIILVVRSKDWRINRPSVRWHFTRWSDAEKSARHLASQPDRYRNLTRPVLVDIVTYNEFDHAASGWDLVVGSREGWLSQELRSLRDEYFRQVTNGGRHVA